MIKLVKNVSLKKYSHFKIGGQADFFVEPKNLEELKEVLEKAKKEGIKKIFILGGGANMLFDDKGFRGLVIRPVFNKIEASEISPDDIEVKAGSGLLFGELLNFCVEKNLSGLEWAGGLPGTLGGAVRGNAGAFKGEMKDSVIKVISFNLTNGKITERKNKECDFNYRDSIFKKKGNNALSNKELIIEVVLALKKRNGENIKNSILEKINYRHLRQPLNYPNIGSIFKNVNIEKVPQATLELSKKEIKTDPFPVVPAAFLISEAGLKGKKIGGAKISEKHPNFIINFSGRAKSSDVKKLISFVKKKIFSKFSIYLEEEVVYLKP